MGLLFLTNNFQVTQPLYDWLTEIEGESNITKWEAPITTKTLETCLSPSSFDYLISYNYSHIIRKDIINAFPNRIINLHISFLPFNKGASPNFWSFFENTPKGVTIHQINEGLDTGDILLQKELYFDETIETFGTTYAKLHAAIQALFKENWQKIKAGSILPQKQKGAGSIHYKKDLDRLVGNYSIPLDDPIFNIMTKLRQ